MDTTDRVIQDGYTVVAMHWWNSQDRRPIVLDTFASEEEALEAGDHLLRTDHFARSYWIEHVRFYEPSS